MWDLAGQEKYNVIRSMYFQGCVGALLVYDVTRPNTFELINSKWLMDFKKFVKKEGTYILIGNKIDLNDQRVVTSEDGQKLADEVKASNYVETSAKLNQNVETAFKNLIVRILRNHGENI